MFPQIRQIHRFEFDGESGGQSKQCDEEEEVKGMGTEERDVFGDVGCDVIKVCEYRQTGHLFSSVRLSRYTCVIGEIYLLSPHLLRHAQ